MSLHQETFFHITSPSCCFLPATKATSSLGQDLSLFLPAKSWLQGPNSCNAFLKTFCGELGKVCALQQKEGASKKKKGGGWCKRREIPQIREVIGKPLHPPGSGWNSGPIEVWWWLTPRECHGAMCSYHGGNWKTGSV